MELAEARLRRLVTAFASVDPQPDLHTVCPWCERSEHHEGDCPWILANAEVWFDGASLTAERPSRPKEER